MSDEHFNAEWWENHYRTASAEVSEASSNLAIEIGELVPGSALEAGCGEGADAIWLAQKGWQVTATDISPTAIGNAERNAEKAGVLIDWRVADLTTWSPTRNYDLVLSQYVHPSIEFTEFTKRLADAVGANGTLLIVGHDHVDTHSAETAPQKVAIDASLITSALDASDWEVQTATTRERKVRRGPNEITLQDFVVKARRKR